MEEQVCIFNFKFHCNPGNCSQNKDNSRINSIICASKLYSNDLCNLLQPQLSNHPDFNIWFHKNCVSRYLSPKNLSKLQSTVLNELTQKKLRRSHTSFDIFTNCLYCGEDCDLQKDPKKSYPMAACVPMPVNSIFNRFKAIQGVYVEHLF